MRQWIAIGQRELERVRGEHSAAATASLSAAEEIGRGAWYVVLVRLGEEVRGFHQALADAAAHREELRAVGRLPNMGFGFPPEFLAALNGQAAG